MADEKNGETTDKNELKGATGGEGKIKFELHFRTLESTLVDTLRVLQRDVKSTVTSSEDFLTSPGL